MASFFVRSGGSCFFFSRDKKGEVEVMGRKKKGRECGLDFHCVWTMEGGWVDGGVWEGWLLSFTGVMGSTEIERRLRRQTIVQKKKEGGKK